METLNEAPFFVFLIQLLYIVFNIKSICMILDMLLCFILIMSVLNLIKEVGRFTVSYRNEQKYISDEKRTASTFASIAAIITILIFGV